MANEDSRENSVVGGAIKLAAVGTVLYGGYRGGRGLIKNYDDLGRTFGKAGEKASNKILSGLSKFDKSDGSGNAIKEGLDKVQDNILNKDYTKAVNKTASMYDELGILKMDDDFKEALHEGYLSQDRHGKRDALDFRKETNEGLKKDIKTKRLEELETISKQRAEEKLAAKEAKEKATKE